MIQQTIQMINKMLNYKELSALIKTVTTQVEQEIILANRTGSLDNILDKYNAEESKYSFCEPRASKVLVIGETSTSLASLIGIIKRYGISLDRFEFALGYDNAKNYPMDTLKYNSKYCDIFAGPMPHKTNKMGKCSSILADIQNHQEEYPKLTKLIACGELKITKQSFEEALRNSQLMKMM